MSTILRTVTATVTTTASAASSSSTLRATPQGGILDGANPTVYDPKNPITIFIIQAGIIIIFCRLLHWPLSKIRQPRVIAEVIGGVLLGPSVMGRIPGFTNAIFPSAAMPNLTLVANIGLILFLFLVGLEVDLRYMASHWRVAVSVGTAGMVLPFGLGCAVAYGLYYQFKGEPDIVPIAFGTFMLFIGVAMAITAFPVLCRILAELKLLHTPVGVITLAAGVSNDIVGWILLALCVALVNASSGITALWILLVALGYILFLSFAVRPAFLLVLRRTGSLENGPSQGVIALTLLLALASAFFTGVIGIHPIFGAFLVGLICPHDGGFAIKVTEKVEDLVSTVFLPLYFALSGLSTNLGLLDSGIIWGYVIAIITIAFIAKFTGGTIAARLNGLVWRESMSIGVLMSCKGLVELIVLNIGLQAKILSTRTFTMFVVMALVVTFATTPLTMALYPPWYQKKLEAWKRGEIDWDSGERIDPAGGSVITQQGGSKVKSLLVYLRLDNMPSLIAFLSLLGKQSEDASSKHSSFEKDLTQSPSGGKRRLAVHGVRLMELTERGSSVMKVSEVEEYGLHDPLINTFRVFGQLHNLSVSGEIAVGPEDGFADMLTSKASDERSDLLVVPWSESGGMSESQMITSMSSKEKYENTAYAAFVTRILDTVNCDTVVFIDKSSFGGSLIPPKSPRTNSLVRRLTGISLKDSRDDRIVVSPSAYHGYHIFVAYLGGADGQAAVKLALQLADNADINITMVSFAGADKTSSESSTEQDSNFFTSLQRSLPTHLASCVTMETVSTTNPVEDAVKRADRESSSRPQDEGSIVIVGRHKDIASRLEPSGTALDTSKTFCLGAVGSCIVTNSSARSSVLVVQAGHRSE